MSACAETETTTSYRDLLTEYKALNIRLDQLSAPLLAGNADLCDETINDNGIRWHQLSDYPENIRPISQSFWGVTDEPSIFYTLPGSWADKSGYKSGDRLEASQLEGLGEENLICKNAILVSYADEINAFATGDEIIVTSGMLREIDDDPYLTLVLAHELAHNILKHHLNPDAHDQEQAADRTAVILMARAGLDYNTAIKNRAMVRSKIFGSEVLSEAEKVRISEFNDYASEVDALLAKGQLVMP
jgi:hypothetical protein